MPSARASWPRARAARARSGSSASSLRDRRRPSRTPIDVAMTHQDVPLRTEPPAQLLDDRHRAVPASGAADRDRDVQLSFLLEVREREAQEALDLARELETVGAEHELRALRVAAVEVRERGLEVRVR